MRVCCCSLSGTRSCIYCSNNGNYSKEFSIWDLIKDNRNFNNVPKYTWSTSIKTDKGE